MKRAPVRIAAATIGLASVASTLALAVAGAAPVTVEAGNLLIRIDGSTSPKALPRKGPAPIGFQGSASVATRDGSHIPAALGTNLLVDRHIHLDTTGLPTCSLNQLKARTPAQAMQACGDALIGKGTSSAQVQFEESSPFVAKGPLLAFNGPPSGAGGYGGSGYNEQFYYVYADVPIPTALIAIGKVAPAGGKYGYRISISIPRIAGGAGSFSGAQFKIGRKWMYGGRRHSFLNAECADGHFDAQVEIAFDQGQTLKGKVVNPCRSLP